MKHRSRSLSDDDEDDAKKAKKDFTEILDESMIQQFEGSMVTSTPIPTKDILDMFDEEGKPLMSDTTRTALGKLDTTKEDSMDQTRERIKELGNELILKALELKN